MDEKVEEFLEHYGIMGMKWGVRRDVGPDGRVRTTGGTKGYKRKIAANERVSVGKGTKRDKIRVALSGGNEWDNIRSYDAGKGKRLQDIAKRNLKAESNRLDRKAAKASGGRAKLKEVKKSQKLQEKAESALRGKALVDKAGGSIAKARIKNYAKAGATFAAAGITNLAISRITKNKQLGIYAAQTMSTYGLMNLSVREIRLGRYQKTQKK